MKPCFSRVTAFTLGTVLLLASGSASAQKTVGLTEQLRIGAHDGPTALSNVASAVPSGDGRYVFVAEGREQVIKIFDSTTGVLVRTVGGPGDGPGEFRRLGRLTARGDTVYASDFAQQRLVAFLVDGAHVDTRRIASPPLKETGRPGLVVAPTPSGMYWGESVLDAGLVAAGTVTDFPAVVLSGEGEVGRTVGLQEVTGFVERADFAGRIAMFIQPFRNPFDRRAYASDGSALVIVSAPEVEGRTGRFDVTRFSSDGDTVFHRSFEYAPQHIPESVQDSIYRYYANGPFQGGAEGQSLAAAREHVELPETLPPVTATVADPTGFTWLRKEGHAPVVIWDVLDATGSLAYRVQAPEGLQITAVYGNDVWGIEKDDLDIPYVVRYRLET